MSCESQFAFVFKFRNPNHMGGGSRSFHVVMIEYTPITGYCQHLVGKKEKELCDLSPDRHKQDNDVHFVVLFICSSFVSVNAGG